jgi:hypothetical protein
MARDESRPSGISPLSSQKINRAKVLRLIRDGKVQSLADVYRFLYNDATLGTDISMLHTELETMLHEFELAGLIQFKRQTGARTAAEPVSGGKFTGPFKPSPLIKKVQRALGLTLTRLSQILEKPQGILVDPSFRSRTQPANYADVFVIMPFSDQLRKLYENVVVRACKTLNLNVSRADDFFAYDSIIEEIWRGIYSSRVVIADCTGRNPNVFYEIGIAHTIGKTVVLISQNLEDVPFDLRHRSVLVYDCTEAGLADLRQRLMEILREIPGLKFEPDLTTEMDVTKLE